MFFRRQRTEPPPRNKERVGTIDELSERNKAILGIHLEEYKTLRSEIADRVKNQFVIAGSAIVLSGVAGSYAANLHNHKLLALLTIPILSVFLGILSLAQETSIAVAAAYLHRSLRPAILQLIGRVDTESQLLNWEEFRNRRIYEAPLPVRLIGVMASVAGAIPGLAVIVGATTLSCTSEEFRRDMHSGEYMLLGAGYLAFGLLGVMGYRTIRLYKEIADRPGKAFTA